MEVKTCISFFIGRCIRIGVSKGWKLHRKTCSEMAAIRLYTRRPCLPQYFRSVLGNSIECGRTKRIAFGMLDLRNDDRSWAPLLLGYPFAARNGWRDGQRSPKCETQATIDINIHWMYVAKTNVNVVLIQWLLILLVHCSKQSESTRDVTRFASNTIDVTIPSLPTTQLTWRYQVCQQHNSRDDTKFASNTTHLTIRSLPAIQLTRGHKVCQQHRGARWEWGGCDW